MELSPDSVLQLAPAIRTRTRTMLGTVLVDSPLERLIIDIGPRGFGVLALFWQPIRLGEAYLTGWSVSISQSTDLAPILSVLSMLIEESALVSPDAEQAPTDCGWADPVEHARMLQRRAQDR